MQLGIRLLWQAAWYMTVQHVDPQVVKEAEAKQQEGARAQKKAEEAVKVLICWL